MSIKIDLDSLARVPDSMKTSSRWMVFTITKNGQKMPISPVTGKAGSSTRSSDWTTLTEALSYLKNKSDGWTQCGLAFALGDGFCGLDLDHVLEGDEYTNEEAEDIMGHVGNLGYAERSVSGDGIHVIFDCDKPEGFVCKKPLGEGSELELYGKGRYFTVSLDNEMFGERDHFMPPERVVGFLCQNYLYKGKRPQKNDNLVAPSFSARIDGQRLLNYIESVKRNTNWGEGNRNHAIFKAAGCIANKVGHDLDKVLMIIRDINNECVSPPLDDWEVQRTVESALSNGTRPVENLYQPPVSKRYEPTEEEQAQYNGERIDKFVITLGLKKLYNHLVDNEQGFLGNYLRYCKGARATEQPLMDLAGAFSCLGTLLSGRVRFDTCDWQTHPNLMIASLAPTGAGKEFCIRLNSKILQACNLGNRIGPDNISSGEGIASAINNHGRGMCFFADEFAEKLGDSSQKRSSFIDSIIQNLKTSFTKSDTLWKASARSDAKLNVEVDQGLVNYLFTSTPESWWSSFRREATGDGLLGRMLTFQSEYTKKPGTPAERVALKRAERKAMGTRQREIPEELIKQAQQWYGQSEDQRILEAAGITANGEPNVKIFKCNDDVEDMLQLFIEEIADKSATNADETTPLWNRASTKVTKIALLLAASENGVGGADEVSESNMLMALNFAKSEVRFASYLVVKEMADSEQERIKMNIEKVLSRKSCKNGLSVGSFRGKGIRWNNDHHHRNALEALLEEARIYSVQNEETGKVKYVHRWYYTKPE